MQGKVSGGYRSHRVPQDIPTIAEALKLFRRLIRLVKPYWGRLIKGISLGFVAGAMGLATPWFSKLLIDEAYPSRNFELMHIIIAGGLAIAVASAFAGALRGFYGQVVTAQLASVVGLMFFNHLQHLSMRFYDEHRVGEVLSRFGDLRGSLGVLSSMMETLLLRGVYLIVVPPLLLYLNWKLTVIALISVPPVFILSAVASRMLRKHWKASAEAHADLSALRYEILSHIRTIKGLSAERLVFQRARTQVALALRLRLRASGFGTLVGVANSLLRAMGVAVLSWYAWTLIISGSMTLGAYIAFMAYLGYVTGPIGRFVSMFSQFQQSAVTLGRAFEYLDEVPEMDPAEVEGPANSLGDISRGRVELSDVSFGYGGTTLALRDLTVVFEAGAVAAVVGPSGSGKSTLLKLIAGCERPLSGDILLDDASIATTPLRALRRQVTALWQDTSLLPGTVLENLTLGAPGAVQAKVDQAVRLCRLSSVIAELEDGYNSIVAEWGASLSGGQRQRVALARAVLRDTPILLLDEAMSNIDVETEIEILRDLIVYLRGRTLIFVTHRPATAAMADIVHVFNEGSLLQSGSHQELLESCDLYRRMNTAGQGAEGARHLRAVIS